VKFVRPLDPDKAVDTGFKGYRAQYLASQESALLIASWIAPGGCGPSLHYHDNDQLYYLVHGKMNVQLGQEVQRIGADSFVFIPAGLAHRNWNDGDSGELHFEAIVPCPGPGQPMLYFVESPEDAPGSSASGYVYLPRDHRFETPPGTEGLTMQRLVFNDRVVVNLLQSEAGGSGPGLHIHEFDQYYFVLEGVLEIQVALQRHTVGAGHLVVLPAGVPHRQWNGGSGRERHLAVLAPALKPDVIWDWGVSFESTGDNYYG
jgi:quercetin dioxygenase-like cupin family protein